MGWHHLWGHVGRWFLWVSIPKMTVRTLSQIERSARAFLRQAIADGLTDDDEIISEAARMMGREHLAVIGRVFAREFKTMDPV